MLEPPISAEPGLSSHVLRSFSNTATLAGQIPVHPTYLPIAPLTLLHALRVSHGTLQLVQYSRRGDRTASRPNLVTTTFLALTLLFGSVVVTSALLAIPSPILLAPATIFIYAGVHIFNASTGLADVLLSLNEISGIGLLMDLGAALIDGVCRSEGIAQLGVVTVREHPNPLISASPFAAILIGTLVGGGGPLLIGAFSLEEDNWTLRTPTWLTSPSSLLAVDVWSSALLSALYAGLTSPLGFSSLIGTDYRSSIQSHLKGVQTPPILYAPLELATAALSIEHHSSGNNPTPFLFGQQQIEGAYLSTQEAHALCGIVLFTIIASTRLGVAVLSPFSRESKKSAAPTSKTKAITKAPTTPSSVSVTSRKKTGSATSKSDTTLLIDEKNGFASSVGSAKSINGASQKKKKQRASEK